MSAIYLCQELKFIELSWEDEADSNVLLTHFQYPRMLNHHEAKVKTSSYGYEAKRFLSAGLLLTDELRYKLQAQIQYFACLGSD